MKFRSLIALVALLATGLVFAEPQSSSEYVKVFASGYPMEKQKAMESLAWAGLSSAEVFDPLEAEALAKYPMATDRTTIDYVSWLVKALAYSGQQKYMPTIAKIAANAPHKKLKKYALQAQKMLPMYTKYNPIIAPAGGAYPSFNQRLANMLKSGETELVTIAAKRIYFTRTFTPELLGLAKTNLEKGYKSKLNGDMFQELAWQTRALVASHDAQYRPLIDQVASSATEKKLRKYTLKYLKTE